MAARENCGVALARSGRQKEALAPLREAVRLHPDRPAGWHNLALCLEQLGRWPEAADAYANLARLRPDDPRAWLKHALTLRLLNQPGASIPSLHRALELEIDHAGAWHALASSLGDLGRYSESAEAFAKAAELNPASPHLGSDAVHLLHYDPAKTPDAMLVAAKAWAARHAETLTREAKPFDRLDRDPDRRLRIGFLSGDFHDHPVGRLTVPLLTHLDRGQFDVVCFDDAEHPDAVTDRLRAIPQTGWIKTHGMKDEDVAARIRAERIGVLVDLSGHMGSHRLLVFARRAAPVQVTHFNYPDTTGMTAMDWRMSDELAEPVDLGTDRYSIERLYRLGQCAWCYDAGLKTPDVGPLPLERNGYVTFASLNKSLKHSDAAVKLWKEILDQVPRSRLMLLGLANERENALLAKRYTDAGMRPQQLIFAPRSDRQGYLNIYNQTDIVLDPFPYNGGITSCDALFMGVPLVTLEGKSYHSRQGLMLMSNLGLRELVARNDVEYVSISIELAGDVDRLRVLRRNMRQRLQASPNMDGKAFANRLGHAYKQMWLQCLAGT